MAARIAGIDRGSLAKKAGLRVGDIIQSINGIEINDYLDFMYASCREEIEIALEDRTVRIENEDYLPLGIQFPTLLIDQPRACHNRCIFCFIDQLPENMRESCYFKDDDYRLSFLQGNYVSMTNMTDADVERILRYNIPRINVSVHTTNPELRVKMLHNKRAGEVLSYLKRFVDGGLNLNAQIVLCPDWNDGEELNRTISDLGKLGGSLESVSVVPVGLSNHREKLEPLRGFDKGSATAVVEQVTRWQNRFLESHGTRLVYLADEFYIMAEMPMPGFEEYEGFPQIENGVGLCASLADEFYGALKSRKRRKPKKKKTVVTGRISYDFMKKLTEELDGDLVQVVPIINHFFGEKITVTGLLTGGDLISQLKGRELGDKLLLSSSMLRHGEPIFLDDVTVSDVENALNIKAVVVPNDGHALLDALLDR
ncbi:MAG: DUF512 domain-containing protein [Clostridia bacterium]|nr:DUF512 domain-containing protein [Clostridia bacterium]